MTPSEQFDPGRQAPRGDVVERGRRRDRREPVPAAAAGAAGKGELASSVTCKAPPDTGSAVSSSSRTGRPSRGRRWYSPRARRRPSGARLPSRWASRSALWRFARDRLRGGELFLGKRVDAGAVLRPAVVADGVGARRVVAQSVPVDLQQVRRTPTPGSKMSWTASVWPVDRAETSL